MKLRSHLLNVLVNDEVEAYLKESDVIIVPFGPTELHGGLPLDCET
ncbi:MAG TPA: creatinine amidohydrolase, partial [Trichococcus sp.]|nr:creatinine amidohydrolase [Trichococcus sp.]